jgi:hypothetical protein
MQEQPGDEHSEDPRIEIRCEIPRIPVRMKWPEKLNSAAVNEIENIVKRDADQTNAERAPQFERLRGRRALEPAIGETR